MAKEKSELTLSDLVRGIQYCVNSSVEIAEQHYIKTLEKFFTPEGRLITQTIQVSPQVKLELPLLCLANHSSLDFEEMTIKTKLSINDLEQKLVETELSFGEEAYQFTRGALAVSLGTGGGNQETSLAELEMVFKRRDPPEALARLIDHINNLVKLEARSESEETA